MTLSIRVYCLACLFLIGTFAHSQSKQVSPRVQLSASTPATPILKGLKVNPVVKIRAYIPKELGSMSLKQLNGRVVGNGWQLIDKIDVFFAGPEPLLQPDSLVASVTPTSASISIAFTRNFNPGPNYVWVSVTLKENADPDTKLEMHITDLIDIAGKKYSVVEEPGEYRKRIGIAIKKAGDGGVHTFRIPGIITTDKGTLISVYDIRYTRSGDLPGNIDVGMSRSVDGGRS